MKKIAVALVATLALTGLTACQADSDACKGDSGVVADKDRDWRSSTKSWDYDLTILRADGTTYEKDVTSTAYDWYKRGSKYPSVKHCKADPES